MKHVWKPLQDPVWTSSPPLKTSYPGITLFFHSCSWSMFMSASFLSVSPMQASDCEPVVKLGFVCLTPIFILVVPDSIKRIIRLWSLVSFPPSHHFLIHSALLHQACIAPDPSFFSWKPQHKALNNSLTNCLFFLTFRGESIHLTFPLYRSFGFQDP